MNKKHLIITSTKNMSREDWLEFRQPLSHVKKLLNEFSITTYSEAVQFFSSEFWINGYDFPCIGGSETATVLGLDPYKASIEVFYSKVGVKPFKDFDKEVMFWGRELEQPIAEKWQYWEGDAESMMENFKNKKIVNRCSRVNAYLQNKDFPWIFVSLDRFINEFRGKKVNGVLECKTMSGFVYKQWENGLPPQYVVQATIQMAVCAVEFGEIAYLKDGRNFEVLSFDFSASIAEKVKEQTKDFYQRVKKGIEHFILSDLSHTEAGRQEHLHAIDMLAPDPDGSEAYKNYLSNRFKDAGFAKPGTAVEFYEAEKYEDCKAQLKLIEAKQTEAANRLKAFMGEANEIDFGAAGKVTWKENAKGSRTINVKIKRSNELSYSNTEKLIAEY